MCEADFHLSHAVLSGISELNAKADHLLKIMKMIARHFTLMADHIHQGWNSTSVHPELGWYGHHGSVHAVIRRIIQKLLYGERIH